jgi:hypothetical protein
MRNAKRMSTAQTAQHLERVNRWSIFERVLPALERNFGTRPLVDRLYEALRSQQK